MTKDTLYNRFNTEIIIPSLFLNFFEKLNRSEVEEEDDTVHMGNAIMTFYAALIDLLGRCAPEMHVSIHIISTYYFC